MKIAMSAEPAEHSVCHADRRCYGKRTAIVLTAMAVLTFEKWGSLGLFGTNRVCLDGPWTESGKGCAKTTRAAED